LAALLFKISLLGTLVSDRAAGKVSTLGFRTSHAEVLTHDVSNYRIIEREE